jgi:hypothetical protein
MLPIIDETYNCCQLSDSCDIAVRGCACMNLIIAVHSWPNVPRAMCLVGSSQVESNVYLKCLQKDYIDSTLKQISCVQKDRNRT